MKSNQIKYIFLLLTFISCKSELKEIEGLPYFNTPDFTPTWVNGSSQGKSNLHTIQDFSFFNQNGKVVTLKDLENKIYVANFFFTICPGICPVMTDNMIVLQEEFKNEEQLMLISHTVTPWIDSVGQLKRYALEKGINDAKYFLLTGEQEEIYKLARRSYFAEKEIGFKKDEDDFLHSENLLLIDKDRHIRGIFNGTSTQDILRLKRHIKMLLGN